MADETKLLGTSGKEAIPFEYQVEEQKIARRRAVAQAMLAQGMKAPAAPQMFGRHMANTGVMPHIVNALSSFLGQRGMAQADEDQTASAQRMRTDQGAEMAGVQELMQGKPSMMPQAGPPMEGQTELPPVATGPLQPDLKGAIARAMQGRFGSTREYGAQLHKDNQENIKAISAQLGAGDPLAGATFQQGQNANAPLPALRQPSVTFGQFPNGGNFAASTGLRGGPSSITAEPKPMQVTNTNSVGGKAEVELDKANIGQLETARKEIAPFVNDFGRLQRVQQLLNQGAQAGGLTTPIQAVRKVAQGFGINVPETGLTDELRAKLGEAVLPNAKILYPVTNDDAKRLDNIYGSIDTDPNALKELNAFTLAKYLVTINQHNAQVDRVAGTNPELKAKYEPFKLALPTGAFDQALALRAMQILKENGHDVSMFKIQGTPVSEMEINVGFQKPSVSRAPPPPGITRVK